MKNNNGFTLIELLVVIAIIAILAAILFPVFTSAKEKSRQATCLNNMKQLGTGIRIYLDDWQGKYPGTGPTFRWLTGGQYAGTKLTTGPEYLWLATSYAIGLNGFVAKPNRGCIFPYVRTTSVYVCPSDTHARLFKASYSMNTCLDYSYPYPDGSMGVNDSQIRKPTKIMMLIDEGAGSIDKTTGKVKPMVDGNYGPTVDIPADVHIGGCNFVFCDGHGAWVKHEKYKELEFWPR